MHCQPKVNAQQINGGCWKHLCERHTLFTGDYQAGFRRGHSAGRWPIQTGTSFDLSHFQVLFWHRLFSPISLGLTAPIQQHRGPVSRFSSLTQEGTAIVAVCCAHILAANLFREHQRWGGRVASRTKSKRPLVGAVGCQVLSWQERSSQQLVFHTLPPNPCKLACH